MPTDTQENRQLYFALTTSAHNRPIGEIVNGELKVREDMTHEEWVDGLRGMKEMKQCLTKHLASFVKWGQIKWGKDEVNAHLAQLEFDMPTVTAIAHINNVPESVRRPELTADHYVVLARSGLKIKDMQRWARDTVEQNLSPSTLKASIPAGEVVSPSAAKAINHGILSPHGIRNQFDIWIQRVGGAAGIRKQGPEYVADIIRELGVIKDFVERLEQPMNGH